MSESNADNDKFSYLQMFWINQTVISVVVTAYYVITGSHWDKSFGHRNTEDKLGWFQFRKRPLLNHIVTFLTTAYMLFVVVRTYCLVAPSGRRFKPLYDLLTHPKRESSDVLCTLVALTIYLLHNIHRIYECLYVSIFSRRQIVNPVAFLLNVIKHFLPGLTIIAESPALTEQIACLNSAEFHWYFIPAGLLFIWASRVHHQTHADLARIRKNKAGHIVTTSYKTPKGVWFDRLDITCPHYLAEVVVHIAIGIALGMRSKTWWTYTVFVIAHHVHMAYNTRELFRTKFEDFPKDRKMIVPFLF